MPCARAHSLQLQSIIDMIKFGVTNDAEANLLTDARIFSISRCVPLVIKFIFKSDRGCGHYVPGGAVKHTGAGAQDETAAGRGGAASCCGRPPKGNPATAWRGGVWWVQCVSREQASAFGKARMMYHGYN
jgi:hypothetical protein